MRVGVLSLQGDFALHAELLQGLGVDVLSVRRPANFDACDALVLPGGESTVLHRLLRINSMLEPLVDFARQKPLMGTCAGCILMATQLEDAGGVEPLGLVDMTVRRNGYGRQVDSFLAPLSPLAAGFNPDDTDAQGVFIRAPRITRTGEGVDVVACHQQEPVAVRSSHHFALTFHPEVARDPRWHAWWLATIGA